MLKQFLSRLLLLLSAIVLAVIFFPIGIIVTIINAIREGSFSKFIGYISKSVLSIATAIDTMANTTCRDLLNGWMRKSSGYEFGNYRETISRVIGKNEELNTLTDAGRALNNFLNWIDTGHTKSAAEDI